MTECVRGKRERQDKVGETRKGRAAVREYERKEATLIQVAKI